MLLIFHHIAKTAGTSLRAMLKQNYQPHELWELYGPNRDSVAWYQAFYADLTAEQKSNMRCVAAHTAHFLMPVLIAEQRPFKTFCLLRDPVDRMISLYQFVQSLVDIDPGRGGQTGRAIRDNGWQLADIYQQLGTGQAGDSELHELFKHFFNGQTRTLLAPHTDIDQLPFNATELEQTQHILLSSVLEQYYIIGVQEHYQKSIQYLAQQFNWHTVTELKENIASHRLQLSPEITQLIQAHNQLDMQLHQRYLLQLKQG